MAHGLRQGDVFARRYRVERLIAAGGMGAIYEVVHLDTQRRRALKVMLPHVLQSDEMRERFKREALVAAGVESEFIVDVFDAGVDEDTQEPFLVMELLHGEDLGKHLKRAGRLSPADAVSYLHQTARALDKMHRASLVHRDLKPENIFLAEREEGPPRVKLLDFGVAKVVIEGATGAGATEVVGTPSYMAPEQFRAGIRITAATDIYALGLTAYALLVGAPYWYDETISGNAFAIALVAVHGPSEPASMRAARRGVELPPGFDAWFSTVTAVDPAQRYVTATATVRALAQVLGLGLAASTTEGVRVSDAPTSDPSSPPASTPVPGLGLGLPSYSATVRNPRTPWRPALIAVVMMVIGGALALVIGLVFSTSGAPAPPAVAASTATATQATAASVTAAPPPASVAPTPQPAAVDAGSPEPAPSSVSASTGQPSVTPPKAVVATPRGPSTKSTPRSHPTAVYSQE